MNPITKQFHIQQVRLRCQGGKAKAVKGESVVRPLFNPELATVETKDNTQRLVQYIQRRAALEAA